MAYIFIINFLIFYYNGTETNGTWTYYGKYTNTDGERINYKKRGFKTKKEAKEAECIFRLNLDPTVR
ncbi:MAG: Arm DNA-binding domain-containing protein [Longicatena sp.]|nr:Arm DNA-binding domain-containing protein [Longicatena sp.]